MKSTIGRKIGLAFLALLILTGVMVGITSQGFDKVIASLDNIDREAVKRGAAGNLRFSIVRLLMTSNDYIITEKDYYHREYNRLSSRVDDFYRQFIQFHLTEEEHGLVGEIKRDLDSIRSCSAQIFSTRHPRRSPEVWALMETMDYRFGEDVNVKTTQIFDGISHRIEEQRVQAAANKQNASNSTYAITFLGIITGLVVSYLTVQRISKPIVTVTKAANGIANGDYSLRPVVKTHDEVAALAQSFSRMAESIQQSQHALEESKRLTDTIVATVPSGLLVFGSDGKILSVNNSFCNIFGLVRDVLIDEYVEPVFKELGISEECRNHILARKPVRDIECTYSDPTRGTLILSMTLFPMRLTNGESLLVIEDTTKRKLAEQIIVDSEKRFRAFIENSSDGLSILSADGSLLYESLASSRIVGYTPGELLGKNVFTLIHPDDFQLMMNLFAKLLKEPSTIMTAELRLQRKDGTWRWIEATAHNLLHDPTIGGVVANFRDITQRKRADEALRQSEEKFSKAFHSSPDSVTISTIPDGKVVETNEGFTRIFGYSREEAIGRTTGELNIWANPEDRQRFLKTVQEEGFVRTFEFNVLTKSGEIRLCQVSGDIVELEGQRCLLAITRDITERKQAEQELEKLSRAVEQTADIVFITDRNGLIEYVNPAFEKSTGYKREEVIGKTPRILKSGEYPASFYEPLWKTILDGLPFRSVLINRKKDGTTFFEEKTITPLRAEDGTIMHFVSTGKDVTEQTEVYELLRQSEEKQRLVLSNMHEIVYSIRFEEGNFLTGTVDFVNDPVENILGFSAEEFRMNPRLWLQSLHPEDLAAVRETTERLLTSKKPVTRLYRIKHKHTGEYRWMEDHIVPQLATGDKKVVGIFGVARDITERKQAQEQIAMLAHALKSIGECVSITDKDNTVLFVNEAFLKTYGYDNHELLGKHISIVGSPNNLPEVVNEILPATLQGGWRGELLNRRKDGSEFPIFLSTSVVRIDKGQPVALIGVATDFTERKRAQETLVTRARQQASIADLGQYALAESDLLVLMNKATEVVARTLEVEYCKVLELLADGNALLLRAGVGWKQNMVGNATVSAGSDSQAGYTLAMNGPVIVDDLRSETRFRGPALLTDRGVISGMSVIIRGGEHPFGVMGAHTTKRRQFSQDDINFIQAVANILAEAIRRKGAEEKYRDLTESLEQLVYRAHPNTLEATYVNKAVKNMYGYTAEEWLGDRSLWEKTIHPDDRERVLNILKTAAQKTQNGAVAYRIIRKDDAVRWVDDRFNWTKNERGELVSLNGIMADITERKQAEEIARVYAERLQVLSKQLLDIQENERRSMARELHDEIGQTLTSLKILLEMSTKTGTDNARENLQEALGLIGGLIGRVRNLSLDLRPPALDDLGLVPAIRWHLLHRTEKMGIEAHFKAEPEEIHVSGEIKTTCFRVAQEALTNVLKHSKPKSVEVQIMKRGANLELAVRDDGTGFDVDSAFRRAAAGESFGLLGMQERVRLAGGTLVIRSEQGQGSEVQATFPNAFAPSL